MAYSPDGSLLATGAGGGAILLRETDTGEIKARLTRHRAGIPALAFGHSGRWLASGELNGRPIVWNLATEQPLQQLQVGPCWVGSIAFLDGGLKLVSEVSNGPVVLSDLSSGRPEARITRPGGIRPFVADPAHKPIQPAWWSKKSSSGACPGFRKP
jgi:WD40 repeat protein